MNFFFIVNPNSGKKKSLNIFNNVKNNFHDMGIKPDLYLTEYSQHATELIKNHPGATIISDVKASDMVFSQIKKIGGSPLMWKTGHSFIKEKMRETGALLAGEMSGHIFFADN